MTDRRLVSLIRQLENLAVQLSWSGEESAEEQDTIRKHCRERRKEIVKELRDGLVSRHG
jgi:hypothetical protein